MAKALRPIGHEDHLSLVEHLDELRSRLIVSIGAAVVAFGVCFWQNHALLNFLGRPVKRVLRSQAEKGQGLEGQATQSSGCTRREPQRPHRQRSGSFAEQSS